MALGVSFCIPTAYDRYETVVSALDSVLSLKGLDKWDYEILVSDDGESQKVWQLIEGKANPRIRYFRTSRHGQFNNLNNLVRLASKPWLLFLHDDDLLHREYLTFFSKVFEANNRGVEIFFANRSLINREGRVTKERVFSGQNRAVPMVTGLAVKKELAERVGGFDPRLTFNADALFLYQIFFLAKETFYAEEPLVSYRIVDDSERSKPSKQGIIHAEMKKLLAYQLDFLRTHLKGKGEFQRLRKEKVEEFYKNATRVNGSLVWIALRYEGGYLSRLKILRGIVRDILGSCKKALLSAEFYLSLFLAVLPQRVLKALYRVYLR